MPKKRKQGDFDPSGFDLPFLWIYLLLRYIRVPGIEIVVTEKDGGIMLLMAVNEHESFRVENSYATNTKIVLLQFFFFFYVAHRDKRVTKSALEGVFHIFRLNVSE